MDNIDPHYFNAQPQSTCFRISPELMENINTNNSGLPTSTSTSSILSIEHENERLLQTEQNNQEYTAIIDKIDEHRTTIHKTVDQMISRYMDNAYMLPRIIKYLSTNLSTTFENMDNNHQERVKQTAIISHEKRKFIRNFLDTHNYYYCQSSGRYFHYPTDDSIVGHLEIIDEDDVLYNILSSISANRELLPIKQRLRIQTMSAIKQRSVLHCVPETKSIQTVIQCFYPAVFASRTVAKYFLTILGDNIRGNYLMNGNGDKVYHMLSPKSKSFIGEMNHACNQFFGVNLFQSFRYRYHSEFSFSQLRLLDIQDNIENDQTWFPAINRNILDIFLVACYYSKIYESSDNYLSQYSNDDQTVDRVFYLKSKSQNQLLDTFLSEYFSPAVQNVSMKLRVGISDRIIAETHSTIPSNASSISWKNMNYLWKHFLETKHLPNVIFQQTFKSLLIERIPEKYNHESDSFYNLYSKYLPNIQKFLDFWDREMMEEDNDSAILEIGEIAILFKKWLVEKCQDSAISFTDNQIIGLLSHYHGDEVPIIDGKYIHGISCKMWNKREDIEQAMIAMNETVDDPYTFYCNYIVKHKKGKYQLLASKKYFMENR